MSLNAITLNVSEMEKSVHFYKDLLGFKLIYGGYHNTFSSLELSGSFINLSLREGPIMSGWGRFIIHVEDVDAMYAALKDTGVFIEDKPKNAVWNERYIHLKDPDGHDLSLAKPIEY